MTQLRDVAEQLAENMQAQASSIDRQLAALDAEQAKLDALQAELLSARDAARHVPKRLANYDGTGCPYCWIVEGEVGALRAIGGTDGEDRFRCNRCDRVVEVDA